MELEPVIGLEVHAQLRTRSKIFCGCSTQFGASPNSNTCPVCLGLPGALPVLNREAVAMAVKAGLALECRINRTSIFARKNYFYPDLPKGYQISQYEQPLAEGGRLTLLSGERAGSGATVDYQEKSFGITRVHLEEDAGKSAHLAGDDTYVDLNRTGVPLIEIVTEPDLRTSQEAYDFLAHLRRVLLYQQICDGNMEEGSLRCDANVSVRPTGSKTLGTKAEIKNLNSFRFLQKALDFEIARQIRMLQQGGRIEQETRLWSEEKGRTSAMRGKEEAHDYRYFPEPDLLPVQVSDSWVEELKSQIPELPEPKRKRIAAEFEMAPEEAHLIVQSQTFADFFETAARACKEPKLVFNWMMGDLNRVLKRDNSDLEQSGLRPEGLSRLILLVRDGKISGKIAKQVFEKMVESGQEPDRIVQQEGLRQISDEDELKAVVDRIVSAHPGKVQAYRDGKQGLIGFFVGQVMRETRGQANPQLVNEMLRSRLQSGSEGSPDG